MSQQKKICVIGLGFIGLPTACLFAIKNYQVVGVEIDKAKVKKINKGECPFKEPGMPELLKRALKRKKIIAKTEIEPADVFIIAVQTPLDEKKKKPDLRYVIAAAQEISKVISEENLVILESTIPPQATQEILIPILEKSRLKAGKDFFVSHCPERAMPGHTLKEMIENYRIIGSRDKKSAQMAKKLYSSFVKGKIFLTNLTTAEVVKLMENTYRDINIALANEFAKMAQKININIWEAIKLANFHPRVNIHLPGPGAGGHCIPKDPWFLIENSQKTEIIKLARRINDSMPNYLIRLISQIVKNIKKRTITILGVAYKSNVDDIRVTPALKIIELALKRGWKIKVNDPYVKKFPYKLLSLNEALKNTDCAVLVTNHDFYKKVDFKKFNVKNIFDTRNFLDKNKLGGINLVVLGGKNNM